jgi:hypothetical protein
MSQYEYTVVQLPDGPVKTREIEWGQLINSVAGHGWRLHKVTSTGSGRWSMAIFERERGQ